jgi:hypothetical protein
MSRCFHERDMRSSSARTFGSLPSMYLLDKILFHHLSATLISQSQVDELGIHGL